MSKNIMQSIVVILGILIVLAFGATIYGMYLKISTNSKNQDGKIANFYVQLSDNEKIKDIEVIDKNRLLLTIESADNLKGAIYDINNNKITGYIQK
tara:strand:+ start:124 stop:411 length:288 start_codon:yes stop_codon:yes gene_type:complete